MKKRIGIVTQSTVRNFYRDKLERLLGEWFTFYECSLDELLIQNSVLDLDAVMFNVYSHYRMVAKKLSGRTQVIIIELTISRAAYEAMCRFTEDKKVLYVNLNRAMAADSVLLFQNLGLTHIDYALFYPGKRSYPKLRTAITNGEAQFVPRGIERVIDLGHRELSPLTITELLTKLNCQDLLAEPRIQSYFCSVMVCEYGLESLLDRSSFMERQLDELMDIVKKGVIFADQNMNVVRTNGEEEVCLGKSKGEIVGKKLYEVFQDPALSRIIQARQEVQGKLLEADGHYYSVSVHQLRHNDEIVGTLLLTENFNQIERRQNSLKSQIVNGAHHPRYSLQSMVGDSPVMQEQRRMIQRFALSSVPVLITGETGTGKEVAAQSIHSLSSRKERNFVAINCAAIPQNLLESELFGYERGAFTGALKEGKVGKFELADGGTLFLDEIGDIPLHLQGQLLRAIQEKEVVRLGGNRVIRTDCRIIAATNKCPSALMRENKFRPDLYYRLNGLPLRLSPLREHAEDIPLLMEHFRTERSYSYTVDAATAGFLLRYPWPGNVRELINCVDYFGNLFQAAISLADLPASMRQAAAPVPAQSNGPERAILQVLLEARRSHRRLGRRSLCGELERFSLCLTENEIRSILTRMAARGLIDMRPGRAGTVITPQGVEALSSR